MAIGWLAALQMVPWAEVIANAPKVADGARKLWNSVGKEAPPVDPPSSTAFVHLSPEAQAIATLQAKLAVVESATSELQSQMLASSELIKALSEQNAQLVKRIERNRLLLLRLAGASLAVSVALAFGLSRALV